MSLKRTLAVIAGVYVIEGYPFGIFRDLWPVYFRQHGVSLAAIGALSGLYAAWSLKFLWSPLVDRFGDYRHWIAGAMAISAAALLLFPLMPANPIGAAAWLLLGCFCLASATQDIAIDAYTIGLVPRGEEGPANAVRITAYRVALVLAGGGLLLLVEPLGWAVTWRIAALLAAALAAAVLLAPAVEQVRSADYAPVSSLGRWLAARGGLPVLLFVLLFRLGDMGLAPMAKPFWVDAGMSNREIALVSTTLGAVATVAGAAVGAGIVARLGIGAALLWVGLLALGSNLGYAAAAALPQAGHAGIYAASLLESFCGGLAAAGFLSYLMRICEKQHAAVQYATLTGLYALPGVFAGAVSGRLVEWMGYAAFFAFTALIALPAFAFLPAAQRGLRDAPD